VLRHLVVDEGIESLGDESSGIGDTPKNSGVRRLVLGALMPDLIVENVSLARFGLDRYGASVPEG
jgi:hypothetical protein